jgi:Xaa-Pro dipeptidase
MTTSDGGEKLVPRQELWFSIEEFRDRVGRVQAAMREQNADVLLAFHPASVTWLTGFFSTAYMLFSVAIVPAEGDPTIVCRDNEEYWLRRTCPFERVVFWVDGEGGEPAAIVRRALDGLGATGARIGVESAFPYGIALADGLHRALPDATFVDMGPAVVARLREIKSPAEIDCIRAASRAVEAGTDAGIAAAHEGATEREVAAAISSALILSGSDVAGPGPMGSGERARHLHATFEDRPLERGDALVLEVDGCVRHYYSSFFRTALIGDATPEQRGFAREVIDLQDRTWDLVKPGAPVAEADRVLRSGIERLTGKPYTNNSFGSIGLTLYPPAPALLAVASSDGGSRPARRSTRTPRSTGSSSARRSS